MALKIILIATLCILFVTPRLCGAIEKTQEVKVDYVRLSQEAFNQGDLRNGAIFLEKARQRVSGKEWIDYTLRLVKLDLMRGEIAIARKLFDDFKAKHPEETSPQISILEAQILAGEGEFAVAQARLDQMLNAGTLAKDQLSEALSALGAILMRAKKYAESAEVFGRLDQLAINADATFIATVRHVYALQKASLFTQSSALLNKMAKDFTSPSQVSTLQRLELCQKATSGEFADFDKLLDEILKTITVEHSDYLLCCALQEAALKNPANGAKYYRLALRFADTDSERRALFNNIARELHREKKYKESADTLNEFLNVFGKEPNRDEILLQIGDLYAVAKEYKESLTAFEKITLDTALPLTVRLMAAEKAVIVAKELKDGKAIEQNLRYIITNSSKPAERQKGLFLLGEFYFKSAKYNLSLEQFSQASIIEGEYKNPALFWEMLSYIELKDYRKANSIIDNLLLLKDEKISTDAKFYAAKILELEGNLAAAQKAYVDFAKNAQNSNYLKDAKYSAASIAEKLGDYASAAHLYAAYANRYKDDSFAANFLYLAVKSAFLGGKYELIIPFIDSMTKEYPTSNFTIAALFIKVDYLKAENKLDLALRTLKEIESLATQSKSIQGSVDALYGQAQVLEQQKKSKEALNIIADIIKNYPQTPSLPWIAILGANISSNNGDYIEAKRLYQLAQSKKTEDTRLQEICLERIADCDFSIYGKTRKAENLENARNIYKTLSTNTDTQIANSTLYKYARTLELQKENRLAVNSYSEVIYRALSNKNSGIPFDKVWAAKSLYAATNMLLKKETISGAREALKLLDISRKLDLNTGEDFMTMEKSIRRKYRL